jgi:hypothetical protein
MCDEFYTLRSRKECRTTKISSSTYCIGISLQPALAQRTATPFTKSQARARLGICLH